MSPLPLLLTALCSVSTGGHFLSLGVNPKEDKEGKKPIPKSSEFAVSLQWPSGVWGKRQSHTPHPREFHTNSSSPRQTSSTQHHAGAEGESKASCTFRFLIIKNSSICFSCQQHRAERGCWAATATQKMRARVDWAVSRTAQCSDGILLSEGRQTPVIQPSNSDPSRNLHFPA